MMIMMNTIDSMETVANLNANGNVGGTGSTPSLSPDLAASSSSSSESCPSPMSHSPPHSLGSMMAQGVANAQQTNAAASPRCSEKHSTRSHSPSSTTSSSSSSKSSSNNLHSTPKRNAELQFQQQQQQQQQRQLEAVRSTAGQANSPLVKSHEQASNDVSNTSSDDCSDEIKVYNEEGAAEEEQRNSENLSEEKTEIIKQNIEVN